MDNNASSKLHHSNVLLNEQLPMSVRCLHGGNVGMTGEMSPVLQSLSSLHLGLRCLRGPVQCSVYTSTTTTLHQWPSGVTVRCPMIGSHVTRSLCPLPLLITLSLLSSLIKGKKWNVLRWNVETILGLTHFSIFWIVYFSTTFWWVC